MVMQIFVFTSRLVWDTFGSELCSNAKNDAASNSSNSCLKYIHTNFSINIRTGTWYIEQSNDLYPKTSAGNTRPIAASNSFAAQTRWYELYKLFDVQTHRECNVLQK